MSVIGAVLCGSRLSITGIGGSAPAHAARRRRPRISPCGISRHLVEAAAHDAQVVLDHAGALAAELVLQLVADRLEQRRLVEAGLLHRAGRGEERALEGDALHAQLQLRVARLLARDLEGVEVEDLDLLVDDDLLEGRRECSAQTSSGDVRSLWMMKTPPFFRPASGLVWSNTFGSGDSTTSTKKYSQLIRIGSGAADR